MTYCLEFFQKFKKEGNFCDLDKSEVSRLNGYLGIVEQLMKQKIPEKQIYENFSVKAARPLISARGEARTEGLNFVTRSLKEGKTIQSGDLQTTLNSCHVGNEVKKLDKSNSPREQKPKLPLENSDSTNAGSGKRQEPITLHPELKKQDPAKTFSPQPGTIPVTNAPPIKSVGEQMKQEPVPEHGRWVEPSHTEPEPGIIPAPRPAPCKDHRIGLFTCPDRLSHFKTEKVRGRVCDVLGLPLNQLPGDECPLERNARLFPQGAMTKPGLLDKGDTAFSRGGAPLPKMETKWSTKILTREERMHVLCTQVLIPKQVLILKKFVKAGQVEDELMALDEILEDADERLEAA